MNTRRLKVLRNREQLLLTLSSITDCGGLLISLQKEQIHVFAGLYQNGEGTLYLLQLSPVVLCDKLHDFLCLWHPLLGKSLTSFTVSSLHNSSFSKCVL